MSEEVVEYVVMGTSRTERILERAREPLWKWQENDAEYERLRQRVAALETDNAKLRTELTLARAALKAHKVEI